MTSALIFGGVATAGAQERGKPTGVEIQTQQLPQPQKIAIRERPHADLKVAYVAHTPAPAKEGQSIAIEIKVENDGTAPSSGEEILHFDCENNQSGGPACPFGAGQRSLPVIHSLKEAYPSGPYAHSVQLLTTPTWKPGTYRVRAWIVAPGSQFSETFLATIEVDPKLQISPAAAEGLRSEGERGDPAGEEGRWTKEYDFRAGKAAQQDFPFERRRQQALAAGHTSEQPTAESAGLLEKLTAQYASPVESENARIRALAPEGAARPRPGPRAGDPSDAVDAVASADPDDDVLGLDPCGKPEAPLEVAAVQATPPLDPAEWVLVQGCGLGTSPGKLRLAGDFPGGYLDLEIKSWASTQVSAQLPPVTGVGDMPAARLQLVRKDGKFSGLLDVGGFRATREVKRIHPTDVIITCGSTWGNDDCALGQSHPLSESEFFSGASFAAKHGVETEPKDCDDSALYCLGQSWEETDLAAVHLANGWTLAGFAWWWNPLGGWNYVDAPAGFQMGSSSATIAMNWGLGLNAGMGPTKSEVRYRVDLYAVGPKGVPYK